MASEPTPRRSSLDASRRDDAIRAAHRPFRDLHLDGDRVVIDDETAFRDTGIRDLAWTAAFTTDDPTAAAAQWLVWEASQALGARSASIQGLYEARARGEVSGSRSRRSTCAPRPSTWRGPCTRRPLRPTSATVILELARSEQTYTFQRPIDYATSVLAGAIAAGWTDRSSSRATITSSTPRSTRPTRRP